MPNEERVEYQAIFDFMFNFINQFIVKSCHKLYKHDQKKKKKKWTALVTHVLTSVRATHTVAVADHDRAFLFKLES